MITTQDKQAFTDLSIIIQMMPKYMQEKINSEFINLIENNKDNSYISKIKTNIPIKYQELSETTEALLALIYRDYLCNDEERKELIIAEKKEVQRLEEENKKRYEINSQKTIQQPSNENTTTALVEYKKETFITKIINKIKSFFNFK